MSEALHVDVETFSECDLKRCGAYKYAEDPSTELLCTSYAFGSKEAKLWIPLDNIPAVIDRELSARDFEYTVSKSVPLEVRRHVEEGGDVKAHNSQFERTVLNGVAGRKVKFPRLTNEQTFCVAAKGAAMSVPRALGDVAKALGTYPKNDYGRADMLALSKPRTGKERRWTVENAPDRFVNLYVYNVDDTRAEQGVDAALPELSASEREIFLLDQRVNDRGWAVDLDSVHNLLYLITSYKEQLANQCFDIAFCNPTQREKIADWVRENGYPDLHDMQAETIKNIVAENRGCKDDWLKLLKIYSTYNMKAVAKYETILDMICADGRLHGMFLYYGAGTGRWSSLGVQLQNLYRPVIDDPETAVEAARERDLDWIKFLYGGIDPMKVFASCVRSVLVGGMQ